MTSRDFCFWLQGFFEIHGHRTGAEQIDIPLSWEQVQIIRKHLAMVFVHEIDPSFGADNHKLDEIHHGVPVHTQHSDAPYTQHSDSPITNHVDSRIVMRC